MTVFREFRDEGTTAPGCGARAADWGLGGRTAQGRRLRGAYAALMRRARHPYRSLTPIRTILESQVGGRRVFRRRAPVAAATQGGEKAGLVEKCANAQQAGILPALEKANRRDIT